MKQRTRLMHSGDDLLSQAINKKTDSDVNAEIPLHKMKQREHFIEAQVQEGDTLQAIALRFYCSISELKRINQIHKDNEIFARRTVKVPVTPYSVLTELIPTSQAEIASTSTYKPQPINSSIEMFLNNADHEIQSAKKGNKEGTDEYSIDCNTIVLNSTLAPAVNPYTDNDHCEPVSEDSQLLPSKPKEPVESVVVKQLTSQGADFGIKWFHLVCIILILCFAIPIIYVIYNIHIPPHDHANSTVILTSTRISDGLPPLVTQKKS